MKCSLVSLIFLKRSLVFPILMFSSISFIDCWGRLSYLSLLFFGTLHSDGNIFSPLLSISLLFTAVCKASSDSHFAFLHFFSMRMVLIPVFCTMSWTCIHSSSGSLSIFKAFYFHFPCFYVFFLFFSSLPIRSFSALKIRGLHKILNDILPNYF